MVRCVKSSFAGEFCTGASKSELGSDNSIQSIAHVDPSVLPVLRQRAVTDTAAPKE
jgi:hypothetical protein